MGVRHRSLQCPAPASPPMAAWLPRVVLTPSLVPVPPSQLSRTCTCTCSPLAAVALGDAVYLWNASTGSITPLMQTGGEGCHVTSIAWSPEGGAHMAIGLSNHQEIGRAHV